MNIGNRPRTEKTSVRMEKPQTVASPLNEPKQLNGHPWIATVLSEHDSGEHDNEARLAAADATVKHLVEKNDGEGVVLFPAGWLSAGESEPRSQYKSLEARFQAVLNVVVCVGIDGRSGKDQVGVAVNQQGIIAIGRKFYPTDQEWDNGIEPAEGYFEQEGGHSRVFRAGGRSYYVAVCYDIFGIRHEELENPGVDVVLGLIHGFCRKGEGPSGDVDFARKGLAGAARQWGCPAYASAVFWGRSVPEAWPSGIEWNQGDASVKNWKYEQNPLEWDEERLEVGGIYLVIRKFALNAASP